MIIDKLNRWVQKGLFAIVVLLFCAPLSAQESEGVRFVEKPFKDVLAQAKAENKMVFIDCYTSWCGPCKMMAAKEFPKKVMGIILMLSLFLLNLIWRRVKGRT